MDSNTSREIILSKIKNIMEEGRNFSIPSHDTNSSVFPVPDNLLHTFVDELKSIGGNVVVRNNMQLLVKELENMCKLKDIGSVYCIDPNLKEALSGSDFELKSDEKFFKSMEVGVTNCEFLVSRTGTVVVSSGQSSGRRLNVFPPVHVVFAKVSQLLPFLEDALVHLDALYGKDFPSLVSFITGPSRTADIEKTLVMGAHGPKELFVFIDENE